MSAAWACTALGSAITLSGSSGAPGSSVEVQGKLFIADGEPIQIRWNGLAGRLLGTATGTTFTTDITIPSSAVAGDYFVVAMQPKAEGGVATQTAMPFRVITPGTVTTPQVPDPAPVVVQPTPTPAVDVAPVVADVSPVPAGSTESRQPAAEATPIPSQPSVAAPGSGATRAVVRTGREARVQARQGVTAATPAVEVAPTASPAVDTATPPLEAVRPEDAPQPNLADLWSGLDRSNGAGQSASLLTSDADQSSGPVKWAVGLVTLGTGVLLAGATAVVRRRRVKA